jgi:hypothetical protein
VSALTAADRLAIADARELAALPENTDAIRKYTGQPDGDMARAVALAQAQHLLAELARIAERLAAHDDHDQADALVTDDQDDEPETYCRTCGADVGIFIGHGGAWLHYTGQGTVASPVELYDAGHAPDVAWRPAGAHGPEDCERGQS